MCIETFQLYAKSRATAHKRRLNSDTFGFAPTFEIRPFLMIWKQVPNSPPDTKHTLEQSNKASFPPQHMSTFWNLNFFRAETMKNSFGSQLLIPSQSEIEKKNGWSWG
jgi:hypothetical protein